MGSAQPASQLQLLSPEGNGPSARAWAIAKDIGSGLLFLHERGFVHRDLKVWRALLSACRCLMWTHSCRLGLFPLSDCSRYVPAHVAPQRVAEYQRSRKGLRHGSMHSAAQ